MTLPTFWQQLWFPYLKNESLSFSVVQDWKSTQKQRGTWDALNVSVFRASGGLSSKWKAVLRAVDSWTAWHRQGNPVQHLLISQPGSGAGTLRLQSSHTRSPGLESGKALCGAGRIQPQLHTSASPSASANPYTCLRCHVSMEGKTRMMLELAKQANKLLQNSTLKSD